MIQKIEQSQFAQYHHELTEAAREILPYLAFSSEETEQFIRYASWRRKKSNVAYQFTDSAGQKVFIGGPGKIEYIIPSNWQNRYSLIKAALEELITEICDNDPQAKLRFAINEAVPSHGAYFIALLPELGFELVPRIEMKADHSLIDTLELPPLPKGCEELPYHDKHFDLFAHAYTTFLDAFNEQSNPSSSYEKEQSGRKHEPFEEYYCYKESTAELRENLWLGIVHQNQIVGYCFSDIWNAGKRMIVLELAVHPAFWGQKLGRYLTIRNMQKMKEHYGTPESYFTIGTQRDNVRARNLYEHLGFKRFEVHTRAFYPKP